MSTHSPKLSILSLTETSARFRIFLHPLREPVCWESFYGFDRPQQLIEKYTKLIDCNANLFSPYAWYMRCRAFLYMRENDRFFHGDLYATEAWLRTNEQFLVEYIARLPSLTHSQWVIPKITICVHAINYALSFGNDTVIVGIRPPGVLDNNYRAMLLLHEIAHLNLGSLPFEFDLPEELVIPVSEVLAMYMSYAYVHSLSTDYGNSLRNLIVTEWMRQNLTEGDFLLLHKKMIKIASREEINTVMTSSAVVEMLRRYRPIDRRE